MKLKGSLFAGLLATAAFFHAGSAQAAAVTGQANIAGNVNVDLTSIIFNPTFTNTPGALETGSFAGLTGGTIMSLTGGPATGSVNVPNFMSFNAGVATPVTFDLTFIAPGVGNQASCASSTPGSLCTPNGSPFTLLQLTSSTVVASLQLNGVAYTGSAATGSSATTGVFSTQTVIGGTLPAIIAALNSGQALTGITYSASFIANPTASPVPEPASMLLMGLGLAGAGLVARRKSKA
ncbi:MAG: PEP-CTERM sorting domain-containing protein [Bryobacteraceae bacterium]